MINDICSIVSYIWYMICDVWYKIYNIWSLIYDIWVVSHIYAGGCENCNIVIAVISYTVNKRYSLMEDDLWWKMTSDGNQPLIDKAVVLLQITLI